MKEVHKASKKAKVFETQKVVKRLKDIRYAHVIFCERIAANF
jgi:hypothetical protein